MQRPTNLREEDLFRVIENNNYFNVGDIISLKFDDGTVGPYFWNADKSDSSCMSFSDLEPYTKSVRNAQVGDVVVGKSGSEYMVLERWQNTVSLSFANDFKRSSGSFHFDELERQFTLKAEPVVVSDKTSEAIKVLEEAGYNVEKKKSSNPIFSTMASQISFGTGVTGGGGYGCCGNCGGCVGPNEPPNMRKCRYGAFDCKD